MKWVNEFVDLLVSLTFDSNKLYQIYEYQQLTDRIKNVVAKVATENRYVYQNKFANVLPPNRPNQMGCFERFVSLCFFSQMLLAISLLFVKKNGTSRFSVKFDTLALKAIAILLQQKNSKEIKFIENKESEWRECIHLPFGVWTTKLCWNCSNASTDYVNLWKYFFSRTQDSLSFLFSTIHNCESDALFGVHAMLNG